MERFLLIVLLANLALAQPLYGIVGEQAEFLVAQRMTAGDLFAFALLLSILIPVIVAILPVLAGKVHSVLETKVFFLLFGVLNALSLAPLLIASGLQGSQALSAMLFLSVSVMVFYVRFAPIRLFFKILSPAVLIFPLSFLFFSRATAIISPDGANSADGPVFQQHSPDIIFLVLDEFPLLSLLDGKLEIDRERYPNFARLADRSNWYFAATTGAQSTVEAIPEALTGQEALPDAKMLPITSNYPENLFTLLQNRYDLTVTEMATQLCPRDACATPLAGHGTKPAWNNRLIDLAWVYAHIVTPLPWAARLPSVSHNWSGFSLERHVVEIDSDLDVALATADLARQLDRGSRLKQFKSFVEKIRPGHKPQLYYLHTLLPHIVWRYLPDGRQYTLDDGVEALATPVPGAVQVVREYSGPTWEQDEVAVQTAWQRHILQVRFVDSLLGDLLDHLREQDMFENSLIVVMANHGASFIPGQPRRSINTHTLSDISAIPLFIKFPGQTAGEKIMFQSSLLDIMPTIAQTLGLSVNWQWSGASLLDGSRKISDYITVKNGADSFFRYPADAHMPHLASRAQEQERLFGRGVSLNFYRLGTDSALIGARPDHYQVRASNGGTVYIKAAQLFRRVDLHGDFIPRLVNGDVGGIDLDAGPLSLAISVNGIIRAVTRTYVIPGLERRFAVLLPPGVLVSGANSLRVFVVDETTHPASLVELAQDARQVYSLNTDAEPATISDEQDRQFPIQTGADIGRVITLDQEGAGLLNITGSVNGNVAAQRRIVAFRNGGFAGSSRLENGRFSMHVRASDQPPDVQSTLRVFAIGPSAAVELSYPKPCAEYWHFAAPQSWMGIDCSAPAINPLQWINGHYEASLDFGDPSSRPFMVNGWEMEASGISWTVGQSATLEIPLPGGLREMTLTARVKPFLRTALISSQALWIMANGRAVFSSILKQAEFTDISWKIAPDILALDAEKLTLTWLLPDAVSPQAIGAGDDLRVLGLAVIRLDLRAE